MLSRWVRNSLVGGVSLWVASACGSSDKPQGSEGGACYGNGTCDAGLLCSEGKTCVSSGTGGGGNSGAGGNGNPSGIDLEACYSCGDEKCPNERQACDDAKGCSVLLECTVQCASDPNCASGCSVGELSDEERVAAVSALTAYNLCAVPACVSECAPKIDTGVGGTSGSGGAGSGSGGDESGGGSGGSGATGSGGKSSGGSSSGGSSNPGSGGSASTGVLIFDGTGVGAGSEDHGIDGGFYILEDSVKEGVLVEDTLLHTDFDAVDSDHEPSDFSESSAPCITGTLAMVTDELGDSCERTSDYCAWGDLWGGGIGLSLKIEDEVAVAWDATAAGVKGFRFQVSGSVGSVPVRFMVEDTAGNQFCVNKVAVGSAVSVPFTTLKHNCWDPGNVAFDPSKIKSISWQFVPDASKPYPISEFCVDNVYVLE